MCGHAHHFTTENASRGPCNAARHESTNPPNNQRRISTRSLWISWTVRFKPFGGLASASVAAVLTGRVAYTAEIDEEFQNLALGRLAEAEEEYDTRTANDMTIPERRQP